MDTDNHTGLFLNPPTILTLCIVQSYSLLKEPGERGEKREEIDGFCAGKPDRAPPWPQTTDSRDTPSTHYGTSPNPLPIRTLYISGHQSEFRALIRTLHSRSGQASADDYI